MTPKMGDFGADLILFKGQENRYPGKMLSRKSGKFRRARSG